MADNIDDESLEEAATTQSENPPNKIIPTGHIDTINTTQETENMEVHHHSHSHGKKNWKSYIWEFLMLFLAVFCGFLAEYQLENTIEKHREKELIVSLIDDLKNDTTALNNQLTSLKRHKNILDSLIILLSSPNIKEKGADIYYCGRQLGRFNYFKYTDRTVQQLKNAGGYRLIKKTKVSDSIIKYYSSLEALIDVQHLAMKRVDEYMINSRPIFNPLVLESMVDDETNIISRPGGNPSLLSYDRSPIFYIISVIHNLKSGTRGIKLASINCCKEASELIRFLKNEYHID